MTALKKPIFLFVLLMCSLMGSAQEECLATNGYWSDCAEEHPFMCEDIDEGKTLIIPVGTTVTIDDQVEMEEITLIIVRGVLLFDGNVARLNLPEGSGVIIEGSGELQTNVNNNSQRLVIGSEAHWRSKMGDIAGPEVYGDAALPVELIVFEGEVVDERVSLSWATASEINSNIFVVEHSRDGIQFSDIGFREAVGNSDFTNDYTLDHDTPYSGINYYRLRQIDFDGTQNFSPVISVLFRQAEFFKLAQSSDFSTLRLLFKEELRNDVFMDIYDMSGRLILEEVINRYEQEAVIDLQAFTAGQYVLTVHDGRTVTTKSFVKIEA